MNRSSMLYTLLPNWPLEGPKMDALGVLGPSKSVSSPAEAITALGCSDYDLLRIRNSLATARFRQADRARKPLR